MNTRFNYNLHLSSIDLTLVQKGVLYSGSKIYNHLPLNIKILLNDAKHYKSTLKSYLREHTFYSLDEYYQSTSQRLWFFTFYLILILITIIFYLVYNLIYSYYSLPSCSSYVFILVSCIITNALHTFMYYCD